MITDIIKAIKISVEPWVIDASLVEMRISVIVVNNDGEQRQHTISRPMDKPYFVAYFDQIFNEAKRELKDLLIQEL